MVSEEENLEEWEKRIKSYGLDIGSITFIEPPRRGITLDKKEDFSNIKKYMATPTPVEKQKKEKKKMLKDPKPLSSYAIKKNFSSLEPYSVNPDGTVRIPLSWREGKSGRDPEDRRKIISTVNRLQRMIDLLQRRDVSKRKDLIKSHRENIIFLMECL